ncbi:Predicted protein [Anoxybacillus flavithermus WK1]|uniref:Uncharacterized protein n=1 Tax=Anoxybacillus flavithermus (strain DSM 21510 / WK1) TaxID=491915 RepID=B7GM89_ANOFW|nr:Predicted protein [Anoxybacillus flavithermus WK1]
MSYIYSLYKTNTPTETKKFHILIIFSNKLTISSKIKKVKKYFPGRETFWEQWYTVR